MGDTEGSKKRVVHIDLLKDSVSLLVAALCPGEAPSPLLRPAIVMPSGVKVQFGGLAGSANQESAKHSRQQDDLETIESSAHTGLAPCIKRRNFLQPPAHQGKHRSVHQKSPGLQKVQTVNTLGCGECDGGEGAVAALSIRGLPGTIGLIDRSLNRLVNADSSHLALVTLMRPSFSLVFSFPGSSLVAGPGEMLETLLVSLQPS